MSQKDLPLKRQESSEDKISQGTSHPRTSPAPHSHQVITRTRAVLGSNLLGSRPVPTVMEGVGIAPRVAAAARANCPAPKCKCKTVGLVEKRRVWLGLAKKTGGGLQVEHLRRKTTTNGVGRVVSAKKSELSLRLYKGSKLQTWNAACRQARVHLGLVAFVKMGKGPHGEALLEETRRIYAALLSAPSGAGCSSCPQLVIGNAR